jgi:glutaredoxin-like protein NrdH
MTDIIVYTKPACPQCTATKRHLDKRGIGFRSIDMSIDTGAVATVRALGYSSAPVVVAGDRHFAGFRPDALDTLVSTPVSA